MRIKEFIDTRQRQFSNQDNVRSIPRLSDGLKDSQRKVIYGISCHGKSEIKVSQLAEMSSMKTHYEHGAVSLEGTIVGLAQNYPGSNNVNILEPIGQFGSILDPKAGASRYIYTAPSEFLPILFRDDDTCVLEFREVDGDRVEPVTYHPIVPLWALNGSIGIGTGHSVKILPRDPVEVIAAIVEYLETGAITKMLTPSFTGWTGTVTGDENVGFTLSGRARKINTTRSKIMEIPPNTGIDRLKRTLVDLIDKKEIADFDNCSSKEGIDVTVKTTRSFGDRDLAKLEADFKLSTKVSENITLWRNDGTLNRFDIFSDALKEFVDYRIEIYEARRLKQIEILEHQIRHLEQKRLFIDTWLDIDNPTKKSDVQIGEIMTKAGVDKGLVTEFMGLRISALTSAGIAKLTGEMDTKQKSKAALTGRTNIEMYVSELHEASKEIKRLINVTT